MTSRKLHAAVSFFPSALYVSLLESLVLFARRGSLNPLHKCIHPPITGAHDGQRAYNSFDHSVHSMAWHSLQLERDHAPESVPCEFGVFRSLLLAAARTDFFRERNTQKMRFPPCLRARVCVNARECARDERERKKIRARLSCQQSVYSCSPLCGAASPSRKNAFIVGHRVTLRI
jgi:hypothetical protein